MQELGLTPGNTDIFITHYHADHSGNAKFLQEQGFRVMMGRRDHEGILHSHQPGFYGAPQKAVDAGAPAEVLDAMFVHNPTPIMLPDIFKAEYVEPGDVLAYGRHRLEILPTYGHSPGHMSLWDAENGILFLGDHVLFDITPNIVIWTREDDALGSYLNSLKRTLDLPVRMALPAHRTTGNVTLQERIRELLAHHEARLAEIGSIVRAEPGLCAYEIAARMSWNIHAKNWEDFPATQKYFAVCECMSHLLHMKLNGRLTSAPDAAGTARYFSCDTET